MTRINWRPDLSLGNVLTIGTVVVSLIVAWATLQSDVKAQATRVDKLEKVFADAEIKDAKRDQDFNADRLRQTEILAEMRADVRYLRSAIEDMRRQSKGAVP